MTPKLPLSRRAETTRTRSANRTRLGSPVSGSCRAWWVSLASCSLRSVTSSIWAIRWSSWPRSSRIGETLIAVHTWWPLECRHRFSALYP